MALPHVFDLFALVQLCNPQMTVWPFVLPSVHNADDDKRVVANDDAAVLLKSAHAGCCWINTVGFHHWLAGYCTL